MQYLHKEIGCLRNELQFLNTVLVHCVFVCRHKGLMFSSVDGLADNVTNDVCLLIWPEGMLCHAIILNGHMTRGMSM